MMVNQAKMASEVGVKHDDDDDDGKNTKLHSHNSYFLKIQCSMAIIDND